MWKKCVFTFACVTILTILLKISIKNQQETPGYRDTQLAIAVTKDDTTAVKKWLDRGANPNQILSDETIDKIRARNLVEYLHAGKAPVDMVVFEYHENLLQLAIDNENNRILGMLLQKKANPNYWHYHNESTLTTAVGWKNIKAVGLLLAYKANPNAANYCGQTPINRAIFAPDKKSQVAIVRHLLEHGLVLQGTEKDFELIQQAQSLNKTESKIFFSHPEK